VEKVSTTQDINAAIIKQLKRSKTVKITGLSGQNYIAVGLTTKKQLVFSGKAGEFFGALNNGAIINMNGDAKRFLGDTMSSGGIIVQGNTQRGVGIAMSGGIIVIRGSVNGDIGQLARGGTVIISGNCGDLCGAYMFAGELIVRGNLGQDTGLNMLGGTIFFGGELGSVGNNAQVKEITIKEESKLKKYFTHYGISKDISKFKKIIPITKKPWENKVFELEPEVPESEISNFARFKDLLIEIDRKTKTGLLVMSGASNPLLFSNNIKDKFSSNFDRLSILPLQTKSTKNMKFLEDKIDTTLKIGSKLDSPIDLDVPFYLMSRGAGVVSKSCKMAYIFAASKLKTILNTGGVTFPEEIELNMKNNGKMIYPWDSARLGINSEYLKASSGVEIIMGSGSTGSLQNIIPGVKVNSELSELFGISEDLDVILPPRIFDFDVPADLKRHVELVREITEHKIPIFIKFSAGNIYDSTKLAVRAGADAIVVEGNDICDQNAPEITANNLGLPVLAAIPRAKKALRDTRADKRDVKLIASGLFRSGADVFKALALGADSVAFSTSAEIAIGCKLCGRCITNTCKEGIATTHPERDIKLDWVEAGQKLTNYLTTISLEFKLLMALAGYQNLNDFDINVLRALDYDIAAITGVPLAGFDKFLPMWEH
jgi:glutamate synthase domain-containing protein 2